MKKGLLALFCFVTIGCSDKVDEIDTSVGKYKHAKKHFISYKEKIAVDAAWYSSKKLIIGVKNDGGRREGYAMYACELLKVYSINNVTVEIVDVARMKKDEWLILGSADCR